MLPDDWGWDLLDYLGCDKRDAGNRLPAFGLQLAEVGGGGAQVQPGHLPPEDRYKIFQGTARRVYDFTPASP